MSKTIDAYTIYHKEACSGGFDAYTRGHLWSDGVSYTTTTMTTTFHMRGRSGNDACDRGRLAEWGLFLKVMVSGTWSKQYATTFDYCKWRAAGADWTYTFDRKYSTYTVPVKGSYAYYPFSTAVFHETDVKYVTVPAQPVIVPSAPTLSASTAAIDYGQDVVINFTKDTGTGRKGSFDSMWIQYAPSTSPWPDTYQQSSTGTSITISAATIKKLFPNGQGGILDLRGFQRNKYDGANNESAWSATLKITINPEAQVTYYDNSGAMHKADVFIYDNSGAMHKAIKIVYYDSGGAIHST